MGDIRIVTSNEVLLNSAQAAVAALDGWQFAGAATVDELVSGCGEPGDVVLIDVHAGPENGYESCRRLTGSARARLFIVGDGDRSVSGPIAGFCGAHVLDRPLTAAALRAALDDSAIRPSGDTQERGQGATHGLPEAMLQDLIGGSTQTILRALVDPDTGLFNYEFLNFKLDEEFKRARRFGTPLSCVMLGFEGQASDDVLRQLAAAFLETSRDTDVLGRFDESSFLFFLPNTGPDGARVMAERIKAIANARGLSDLVGDPLDIAAGISFYPHVDITRREDLFGRAREAFFAARAEGTGLVTAG
ncbi:MAG: diguanylate cyclase [Planctomycetota bacterium]|nr:diguanylate cyclase [Planctomycetota bacterium]